MDFDYQKDLSAGGSTGSASRFVLPVGRWVHVTVITTFATSPARATIALDGVQAAEVLLEGTSVKTASLGLGAIFTNDANVKWTFQFDNVVADWKGVPAVRLSLQETWICGTIPR